MRILDSDGVANNVVIERDGSVLCLELSHPPHTADDAQTRWRQVRNVEINQLGGIESGGIRVRFDIDRDG